ncbi:hypothetical protein FHR71_001907 [Methylobacterium sp. RAS18]|nr:hypothetical protein [Methylobacterium sp. RAS18]
MTQFVVRVELPNKPHGDYGQLHEEMHAARYYTVVQGDSGKWWHLPHATYVASATDWTMESIRKEVHDIAQRSHPCPRVYVAEYVSSAWIGLRPVTAQDPAPQYP